MSPDERPVPAAPIAPGWRLVRHARVLTPDGFCYGRLDVAADPAHTDESARVIVDRFEAPSRLRCSPRQRCLDLAQALARHWPGVRVDVDPRLAEMDFGRWEGRLWRDVPRDELDQWRASFADHPVGGDGESVRQFMARIAQARDESIAERAHGETATWWVTHAGVIRAMQLLEQGIDCPADGRVWPREALDFGVCHPI